MDVGNGDFAKLYSALSDNPKAQYVVAAVIGFLSHVLFFIHGRQHDKNSLYILGFFAVVGTLLTAASVYYYGLLSGLLHAYLVSLAYNGALFSSIITYRLVFHRTRHFPGPFWGRLTKFYTGPYLNRNGRMHEEHVRLIQEYGNIVRIGPNEILIDDIELLMKIHGGGPNVGITKGMAYDNIKYFGEVQLDGILDRETHRHRRAVWDKAFSSQATKTHEGHAVSVVREWIEKLGELVEQGKGQAVVNTSLVSLLIPSENMGHIGWSQSYGMLKNLEETEFLHILEWMFSAMAIFGDSLGWPVPILANLLPDPRQKKFEEMATKQFEERLARTDEPDDLVKYLLEDLHSDKPRSFTNMDLVKCDAVGIFIAASDTIAVTLSYMFYYLARDKALREQLREELRPHVQSDGGFLPADLAAIDLLDACINETLRIQPPLPTNGSRFSPPGGLSVGNTYIPGTVEMLSPVYVYHRSPKYFVEPNKFVVERWTTKPEMILDKRAFHPFIFGGWNCVGKRLAMILIRTTIANTVWNYDFELAPGEDGTAIFEKSWNNIIMKAGPLNVAFRKA